MGVPFRLQSTGGRGDRVHALDPLGIDIPVQHEILMLYLFHPGVELKKQKNSWGTLQAPSFLLVLQFIQRCRNPKRAPFDAIK